MSPVGIVEERQKIRTTHDDLLWGESVNATTGRDEIPAYILASVMREVLQKILGLEAKFGDRARTLIQNMDIQNAFRHIPVDPDDTDAFGYLLGRYLIVDLHLQFGWRDSSGWWGVILTAMQHAKCNKTREGGVFLSAER